MSSIGYTLNYLAVGSLLLLIYQYRGKYTRSFAYKAVARIGVYSYGIYLWHLSIREPMANITSHFLASLRWGALLFGQYATAIILGVVMTKLVEFPMLGVRDRFFPRGEAQFTPSDPEARAAVPAPQGSAIWETTVPPLLRTAATEQLA
jgi:peptidoglycan/LPS O-acetylase OafA/YrhL